MSVPAERNAPIGRMEDPEARRAGDVLRTGSPKSRVASSGSMTVEQHERMMKLLSFGVFAVLFIVGALAAWYGIGLFLS